MDQDPLNETLAKLQDELKSVTEVDDLSRETLNKLDGDIHRILQNSGEIPPAHHESLRESLTASIEYLETSYPMVAALMNRLVKALSDMGI
jgi:hypothetical protein